MQSITKKLDRWAKAFVWMGGLHALTWMVAYVIENRPELLQKSDNKLVCIVISRGDETNNHYEGMGGTSMTPAVSDVFTINELSPSIL